MPSPWLNKKLITTIVIFAAIVLGSLYLLSIKKPIFDFSPKSEEKLSKSVNPFIAIKFDYLAKNGNSSCSSSFRDSIASMSNDARLQGSCCSPMSMHRYSEQVEGLKKYGNISDIPPDPYDIDVGLAKRLMSNYEMQLTAEEQKAYDYAMEHSSEKGPCCCKCWRWNTYGGLGKHLIRNYGFSGEQVNEVWNLSDGCGGDSEHHH